MADRILIIDREGDIYRTRLAALFPEVEVRAAPTAAEAGSAIEEAEALFAFGSSLDDRLIARAARLQWLQFLSTGTDKLLRLPSLRRDVVVSSAHGVHGPPVSEMAFLHMLVLARLYGQLLRNQVRAKWEKYEQPLLYGKTVTIIGIGLIAGAFARRCKAFDMHVVGVSGSPRDVANFDQIVARSDIEQAVATADFVVVLSSLTAETRGLVSARVLGAMKPTAYLINLARGGICDEDALLEALQEQRIAGAGLDVFSTEPLPPQHPFWRMENVVVTPHIGGNSDDYPAQILPILKTNLRCFVDRRWADMINLVER
jgi:D-2-hydroxyacid dehydrogenase (NADP+)